MLYRSVSDAPAGIWCRAKSPTETIVAVCLLVVLAPLFLVVALAVKLGDRGTLFFNCERVGLGGRSFMMFKFRTMIEEADEYLDDRGNPVCERLTRVGKVLRRYSIDELPQLVNVVRGDMALIGPRPVPRDYEQRMSAEQRRRHLVRPGMTGLAQVTSRHGLSWSKRIELDLHYVESLAFYRDVRIVILTARAVFGSEVLLDRGDSAKVDLG